MTLRERFANMTLDEKREVLRKLDNLFIANEGWEAHENGELLSANPYPPGDSCYTLWAEGWMDAEDNA